MNIKHKKAYPKSYVFMAVAFGILLCGIWTLYGMMYTKDSQISNHCKMSIIANDLSDAVSPDDANGLMDALNSFISERKVELTVLESSALQRLSDDVAALDPSNPARLTNVQTSAKTFANACSDVADEVMANSKKMHIAGDYAMMGIFFSVIAAILFIGGLVRKKEETIAVKEEEAAYLESRAEKANQKTVDIAYKNLIMDCGNRFALSEYISEQIKNGSLVRAAQFELGDYNRILSMVGYTKLDEFMSNAAKWIRDHFEDYGVFFTLSGKEFVFVFDSDVDDAVANTKYEEIRSAIRQLLNTSLSIDCPIFGAATDSTQHTSCDAILTTLHSSVVSVNSISQPIPSGKNSSGQLNGIAAYAMA